MREAGGWSRWSEIDLEPYSLWHRHEPQKSQQRYHDIDGQQNGELAVTVMNFMRL